MRGIVIDPMHVACPYRYPNTVGFSNPSKSISVGLHADSVVVGFISTSIALLLLLTLTAMGHFLIRKNAVAREDLPMVVS